MNNIEDELILYKYISFSKFIDLIENERLYLTRVDLWEDTHEGATFIENYGFDMPEEIIRLIGYELMQSIMKSCIKSMYAQSWTHDKLETDSMWRIYSTDKLGVRIAVKAKDIKRQIDSRVAMLDSSIKVNSYKVEYGMEFNSENIRTPDGVGTIWTDKDILKHKRKAFYHEKEYRFSFSCNLGYEFDKNKEAFKLQDEIARVLNNINLEPVIHYSLKNSMIEEIILDPRASIGDTEMFIKYCENRGFKEKNIVFKKSRLYDKPINKYF